MFRIKTETSFCLIESIRYGWCFCEKIWLLIDDGWTTTATASLDLFSFLDRGEVKKFAFCFVIAAGRNGEESSLSYLLRLNLNTKCVFPIDLIG